MRVEDITDADVAHCVNFSGGKDSTATLLLAIERLDDFQVVFADTGNEHPITYEYLHYIEQKLGIHITRVRADFTKDFERKRAYILKNWDKPLVRTYSGKTVTRRPLTKEEIAIAYEELQPTGNPFLDLCKMKGRFPDARSRFCTSELKQIPMMDQVAEPLIDAGWVVVQWVGVRADESRKRAANDVIDIYCDQVIIYRPIICWTAEEVFELLKRHGIEPNPLYKMGMARVGCMPCIHASQREVAEIAVRFPDQIGRIASWESAVAKTTRHPVARERGTANFFPGFDNVHDKVVSVAGKSLIELDDDLTLDSCSAVYPVVCE
jgi:3'-phosphoadenosine 5'-phosphosulfate sulfotransferase (PAPS reductase)/FAD synthetase